MKTAAHSALPTFLKKKNLNPYFSVASQIYFSILREQIIKK